MTALAQITANLQSIRQRIERACERVGRHPSEVVVLGASKSQPIERLEWAYEAGLRVFGENRVQEALAKQPQLPATIDWHLIGPLQSNKVNKVVGAFSTVHSIDRLKIAQALDRAAARRQEPIIGLLEVNLAEEDTKHGFTPSQVLDSRDELSRLEILTIEGLMAIPPLEVDPEDSRHWFRQLRELRDELFSSAAWGERAGLLSMGMSSDYAIAVEEGATHVRIGSALFGPRIG